MFVKFFKPIFIIQKSEMKQYILKMAVMKKPKYVVKYFLNLFLIV